METHNLTLSALRDKIGNKEISAVEVVKAYKNRIEEQKDLNAVITTDFDNVKPKKSTKISRRENRFCRCPAFR